MEYNKNKGLILVPDVAKNKKVISFSFSPDLLLR